MRPDQLFLRLLTGAATAGAVVCAVVHVSALVGVGGVLELALVPWLGLVVLLPLYAVALYGASREMGIALFDKQAQNRWFTDVFDAVPPRQRWAFWASLAYGLAWFGLGIGLARVFSGASDAAFSAFPGPFYVLVAITAPRLAMDRGQSLARRRRASVRKGAGRR